MLCVLPCRWQAHRELFNQLKSKVRSSTKAKLSDKSDFHMLASASKRSGDTSKAAQALYSLGVTHDNSRAFPKAIEVGADAYLPPPTHSLPSVFVVGSVCVRARRTASSCA